MPLVYRATARVLLAVVLLLPACSLGTPDSSPALSQIIARDLLLFDRDRLSLEIYEQMAGMQVVFLGEMHYVHEHQDLLAILVRDLHPAGFRLLLIEFWHAYGWQLDDYINGRSGSLDPNIQKYFGPLLEQVREFNTGLPEDQRVRLGTVDINYDPEAYLISLARLAEQLPDSQPLAEFSESASIESIERITQDVQVFYDRLLENRTDYAAAWGQAGYNLALELTEIQVQTNEIYPLLRDQVIEAEVRREEVIKGIVEKQLAETPGGTLVNMGFTHLQREHRTGTSKEWLGEYLSLHSPHGAGSTLLVLVGAARGAINYQGKIERFDIRNERVRNPLFATMDAHTGGKIAYLPLGDPFFYENILVIDLAAGAFEAEPGRLFDAAILLPEATPLFTP
jgi:hypothetical protein